MSVEICLGGTRRILALPAIEYCKGTKEGSQILSQRTGEDILPSAGADAFDESSLVESAKDRSEEAWTAIYESYHPPIYRYVRARLFDDDLASDIAAAVFVEAIGSIHRYQYRGKPLLAWFYRIARNLVASHQRKALGERGRFSAVTRLFRFGRANTDTREQNLEQATVAELPAPNPDQTALVERLDLQQALEDLPDSQREVIILRHMVGLSTPEIAQAMGKSATAVYSLEARALLSLRRLME